LTAARLAYSITVTPMAVHDRSCRSHRDKAHDCASIVAVLSIRKGGGIPIKKQA